MSSLESILKSKPITDPYSRLVLNVMVTGVWLQKVMNTLFKPHGITEPQYNVLRILRGQQGAAMNLFEISDRMIHPTSNVSRIIDKLIEKGYVTRVASSGNRRKVDISITAAGLNLLADLESVIANRFLDFASKIPAEEAMHLSRELDMLRS